jgi:type II secretion system protein C
MTGLLAVVLAYESALLIWAYYPLPESPRVYTPTNLPGPTATEAKKRNYIQQAEFISKAYLLGKPDVEVVQQIAVVEEAPETRLNYKLRGIYYSKNDRLSSAIIEVKPNKSQYFKLNDELDEKIYIASIEEDHILIDRYGKFERLNLQKKLPAERSAKSNLNSLSSLNASVSGSPENTQLLRSYKKRYVNNPLALARRFQAVPVAQDGKNIGYKLKALRGESLLKKLNFQENDVFVKINGIGLDKPFQALDAIKSLTTASSVSVTVLRNGIEESLDFSM